MQSKQIIVIILFSLIALLNRNEDDPKIASPFSMAIGIYRAISQNTCSSKRQDRNKTKKRAVGRSEKSEIGKSGSDKKAGRLNNSLGLPSSWGRSKNEIRQRIRRR